MYLPTFSAVAMQMKGSGCLVLVLIGSTLDQRMCELGPALRTNI